MPAIHAAQFSHCTRLQHDFHFVHQGLLRLQHLLLTYETIFVFCDKLHSIFYTTHRFLNFITIYIVYIFVIMRLNMRHLPKIMICT